jgi:hypothetical protein
MLLVFPLCFR